MASRVKCTQDLFMHACECEMTHIPLSPEKGPMGRAPYKSAKEGGGRFFDHFRI